jgi:toxin ParE1/3/4
VAEFSVSLLTEADIDDITAFTIKRWDLAQADRYIGGLESFFHRLAEGSVKGRPCDAVRPGLWRAEYVSHVVFFRRMPDGVRIVRVLHASPIA